MRNKLEHVTRTVCCVALIFPFLAAATMIYLIQTGESEIVMAAYWAQVLRHIFWGVGFSGLMLLTILALVDERIDERKRVLALANGPGATKNPTTVSQRLRGKH